MPVADNDGVGIAYERAPPGDVETVVFVEGWSYGRWMWRWQRSALADDYETVLFDNRGTGESAAPGVGMPGLLGRVPETLRQFLVYQFYRWKYTLPKMAGDLEAVLADAGIERAHVVGASMGGMIAQQYALDYDRAASLTLLCTTAGGDMQNLVLEETMAHLENVPEGLDARAEMKYLVEPATTAEWREANADLLDDIVDWRLEQDASTPGREAQAVGQLGWDVRGAIESLDVPALVVHGDADEVIPLDRGEVVADRLPDAQFEIVEGGSHLCFVEQAETVNDRIEEFLDDV